MTPGQIDPLCSGPSRRLWLKRQTCRRMRRLAKRWVEDTPKYAYRKYDIAARRRGPRRRRARGEAHQPARGRWRSPSRRDLDAPRAGLLERLRDLAVVPVRLLE